MQPRRSYAFPRRVGHNRIVPLNNQRLIPMIGQKQVPPICPLHGTSQVSELTFDTRCSQSPRIARQLHMPVASLSMIDFALFGGLVAIKTCNEAESDSLALRLASLPERIPPPPITQRKRRRTTCQTGNLHDNLLTGYELNQTYLAIPKNHEDAKKAGPASWRVFFAKIDIFTALTEKRGYDWIPFCLWVFLLDGVAGAQGEGTDDTVVTLVAQ